MLCVIINAQTLHQLGKGTRLEQVVCGLEFRVSVAELHGKLCCDPAWIVDLGHVLVRSEVVVAVDEDLLKLLIGNWVRELLLMPQVSHIKILELLRVAILKSAHDFAPHVLLSESLVDDCARRQAVKLIK